MGVDSFGGMRSNININITPRAPAAALAAAMHKAAVSNSSGNSLPNSAASSIAAHLVGGGAGSVIRHPSPHDPSSQQQQTIWRNLAPGPPPQFVQQNTSNTGVSGGVIAGQQVPLLAPAPFPRPTSLVAPMDYRLAKDNSSDDHQQQQAGGVNSGSNTTNNSGVTLGNNSSNGPPLGPPKVSMTSTPSTAAAATKPSMGGMPIVNTNTGVNSSNSSNNINNSNMRGDQFAPVGMMIDQTQRPPVSECGIIY
jgi:hypothetical protein